MLHRKILLYVFLQRGNSRTLNAQVLWLFCRGRPSQHLKFDIELYLLVIIIIIIIFLLRGLGPRYSEGFKATSTKLGRDLGPDVKFEDLSFQTDQTYSFFIMNYLM